MTRRSLDRSGLKPPEVLAAVEILPAKKAKSKDLAVAFRISPDVMERFKETAWHQRFSHKELIEEAIIDVCEKYKDIQPKLKPK
jgi:hypothetical protein